MKKKLILLFIPLIIIVIFIVFRPGVDRNQLTDLVDVSIGIQNSTIVSTLLVAKGRGYFEEEGLRLTIKKYPSGKLALASLFNGEVDLATVADIPIVSNSFVRNDFKVISTIASSNDGAWIIARKDKGINTPKDLAGKTIATQKSSAVHFFMDMFLLHHKIPKYRVKKVFMKAVDLPGALASGKIDAFSMRDPYGKRAKDLLGDKVIEFHDPHIYNQMFNVVGMNSYLLKNREILNSFMKAILKAETHIHQNRYSSIGIVAGELQQDFSKINKVWDKLIFKIALDQTLIITLEEEAKWFIKEKYTNSRKLPDYLDYIDAKYLKDVKPEVVTIY